MGRVTRTVVKGRLFWLSLILISMGVAPTAFAEPVPGGTLDPLTIPKYVQPLVIPPEMPTSSVQPTDPSTGQPTTMNANYNIAVRQFKQQILPGGIWNTVNGRTDSFEATTLWSYGPEEDMPAADYIAPQPLGTQGANFNYPAFTVEATSMAPLTVRWINDLKDPVTGNYRQHLFSVDQTLHWANPTNANCNNTAKSPQTDCATTDPEPYAGPVPIVTHVHGAHVNAESDGYPEAWWLPAASNIPAGYATQGTLFTQYDLNTGNVSSAMAPNDFDPVPGAAFYSYENTQPATTLWYHDHSLGMTRLNVYAGPAGFWLIRGGTYDSARLRTGAPAVLPGPAARSTADPNFDPAVRKAIRDIPIAIQDRSFNSDGSLFYPDTRSFFDGFEGPYVGDPGGQGSDIAPIWNPEAFFNTMVVNGTTWPYLDVAPTTYRFRLLNGCNSRFINLSMFTVDPNTGATTPVEVPFYQIGGDQGFLPRVVMVKTGSATELKGRGTIPTSMTPLPDPSQALLMAPAERADVLVDFSAFPDGTIVRMINTAPDAPFGGFPDIPSDPETSGQVMQFVVNSENLVATDVMTTSPLRLVMNSEPNMDKKIAIGQAQPVSVKRKLSLNEEESLQVCVQTKPDGSIVTVATYPNPNPNIAADCAALNAVPQAPKAALLGLIGKDRLTKGKPYVGLPLLWMDPITENPKLGATEQWEFYNLTVDGHPIHMHLVRYQIKSRQLFDPTDPRFKKIGKKMKPLPTEMGWKDTVLTYPGEITSVVAKFDLPGLYVWHCHIVEHEDNEMMRPFYVGNKPVGFPVP